VADKSNIAAGLVEVEHELACAIVGAARALRIIERIKPHAAPDAERDMADAYGLIVSGIAALKFARGYFPSGDSDLDGRKELPQSQDGGSGESL